MNTAEALLAITGPRTKPLPRKRSSGAVTYSIALKGDEWRVLHGNKIIGRHATEAAATAQFRAIFNR